MKRVKFFKNAVFGISVLLMSLLILTNCEQRRDGQRDTQTTASIESERQELAGELQREINQLNRMITDYETRAEDERLPQQSRDNYNSMASDLDNAKSDLESELNNVQNANPDNWHERSAEARQTISEVNAEVEQITASRGQGDNLGTDDGNQTF